MNLVGPQFGLAGSLSDELEGHFHLTIDWWFSETPESASGKKKFDVSNCVGEFDPHSIQYMRYAA